MQKKPEYSEYNKEQARNIRIEFKMGLNDLVDMVAEKEYQNAFLPVVYLKDCVQYFKEESRRLSGLCLPAGFVISVKKNYDPRNENDLFIVVQGLVDASRKPIVCNGESVSRVMHTRTIDSALIQALGGKETGVFML